MARLSVDLAGDLVQVDGKPVEARAKGSPRLLHGGGFGQAITKGPPPHELGRRDAKGGGVAVPPPPAPPW